MVESLTYGLKTTCPVCNTEISSEKLLSKKVAPRMQDVTLRNRYDAVLQDPLVYMTITCPRCLFTAFEGDFSDGHIKHRPDLREITADAAAALRKLEIAPSEYQGVRDLRLGLAAFYLAEIWYSRRDNLPVKFLRLGLTVYRRHWLLDPARDAGVISDELYQKDRRHCLLMADSSFETSYLNERPPESTWYGPDYGVNHGPLTVPYLIALVNHMLSIEAADITEQITRHKKAAKFLGIVQMGLAREKGGLLRGKVSDLRDLIRAAGTKFSGQELSDEPIDEAETIRWSLSFESLYDKFGKKFERGDVIVKQGDPSTEMYLVLEGRVNVVKTFGSEARLVAVLGNGAFFGEVSLVDSSPRLASVIAVETTRVIAITAPDLEELIKAYPEVAFSIISVLVKRIRNYDAFVQKQLLPLFTSGNKQSDQNLNVELNGLMQEVRNEAYD